MIKYFKLTDDAGFEWNFKSLENACKYIADTVNEMCEHYNTHGTYGYDYNAETETYTYKVCYTNGETELWTIETIKIDTMD